MLCSKMLVIFLWTVNLVFLQCSLYFIGGSFHVGQIDSRNGILFNLFLWFGFWEFECALNVLVGKFIQEYYRLKYVNFLFQTVGVCYSLCWCDQHLCDTLRKVVV